MVRPGAGCNHAATPFPVNLYFTFRFSFRIINIIKLKGPIGLAKANEGKTVLTTENPPPNSSVVNSFNILEYLLLVQTPQGGSDISKHLSINKTTTYSLLRALEATGYVEKLHSGKFQVTSKMLVMGSRYASNMPVVQAARQCKEYFNIPSEIYRLSLGGLAQNARGVYLYVSDPNTKLLDSGALFPLHATALGKVLLAYTKGFEAYYPYGKLDKFSPTTITDHSMLMEQIKQAREQGYALDDGEFFAFVVCCAAPVFGPTGDLAAAVSFSVAQEEYTKIGTDELIQFTKLFAARISAIMGYMGPLGEFSNALKIGDR